MSILIDDIGIINFCPASAGEVVDSFVWDDALDHVLDDALDPVFDE